MTEAEALAYLRTLLAQECSIAAEEILPERHLLDDLGIDSLDLLDASHALERDLGIRIPVADWVRGFNEDDDHDALTVGGLCLFIAAADPA